MGILLNQEQDHDDESDLGVVSRSRVKYRYTTEKVLVRDGYTYFRRVPILIREGYSYLRKVKGRRRRVRITIEPVYRIRRIRVVVKPVYRIVRKRIKVVEEKPQVEKAEKKPSAKGWMSAAEYEQDLEREIGENGFEVTERDEVFHSSPANDWIHMESLFVWPTRRIPRDVVVFKRDRPFKIVRIWFWVYHQEKEEYRLWCRTAMVPLSNWDGAREKAQQLFSRSVKGLLERFDYLEIRGFVAWTAYLLDEKATHRKPGLGLTE